MDFVLVNALLLQQLNPQMVLGTETTPQRPSRWRARLCGRPVGPVTAVFLLRTLKVPSSEHPVPQVHHAMAA